MDDEIAARLGRIAENLGVPALRRHILLCCDQTEPKCCAKAIGLESWEFLKARLARGKVAFTAAR